MIIPKTYYRLRREHFNVGHSLWIEGETDLWRIDWTLKDTEIEVLSLRTGLEVKPWASNPSHFEEVGYALAKPVILKVVQMGLDLLSSEKRPQVA